MKPAIKRGESAIVLGVASALIALCAAGLGAFLSTADAAEAGAVQSGAVAEAGAVTDEVQAPEGMSVKVDLRGIELPEGAVSAQYAVAATADLAERAYGQTPTGRAQAVLYNSETTFDEDYDTIHGLYWHVLMETGDGGVSATIAAATGVDFRSDFSPFSMDGWAQEFDSWDDQVAGSSSFGTEAELVAHQAEIREKYGDDYGKPLMSDEDIAYARELKLKGMMDNAASWSDLPHAAQAVAYVNERGLGNGAGATAGTVLMTGGRGPLDQEPLTAYLVDVALDDGTYLVVTLGEEDLALYGVERSPVDLPTRLYG